MKKFKLIFSKENSKFSEIEEKYFSSFEEGIKFLLEFENKNSNFNIDFCEILDEENEEIIYLNRKSIFQKEREIKISNKIRNFLFK